MSLGPFGVARSGLRVVFVLKGLSGIAAVFIMVLCISRGGVVFGSIKIGIDGAGGGGCVISLFDIESGSLVVFARF